MKSKKTIEKKTLSPIKKLGILASVILLVFTSINLFWIFSTFIPYNNFAAKMDRIEEGDGEYVHYEKTFDGFKYTLSKPNYLDFSSYLGVCREDGHIVTFDSDGNINSTNGMGISLYIWPDVFGNFEYGVFFVDEINDIWEQVMVDKNLNYLPNQENIGNDELNEYIEELISDNYEEIKTLMDHATSFWNIN